MAKKLTFRQRLSVWWAWNPILNRWILFWRRKEFEERQARCDKLLNDILGEQP
jgi:hypothetical protein